jgi:hypothetical protein
MDTFVKSSYHSVYSQLGGVIVLNQGVHCKKPGCVTDTLKKLIEERQVLSMMEQGWHILWRETEHQHFNTSSGYFEGKRRRNACVAIANPTNDYRNVEANEFLNNLTLGKNVTIPVIPLAKASEPLYFMHAYDEERKMFDCTHYVYSPWRFEVTWNGMLQGLQGRPGIVENESLS